MKPRTVMVHLELRDCTQSIRTLCGKDNWWIGSYQACPTQIQVNVIKDTKKPTKKKH